MQLPGHGAKTTHRQLYGVSPGLGVIPVSLLQPHLQTAVISSRMLTFKKKKKTQHTHAEAHERVTRTKIFLKFLWKRPMVLSQSSTRFCWACPIQAVYTQDRQTICRQALICHRNNVLTTRAKINHPVSQPFQKIGTDFRSWLWTGQRRRKPWARALSS